MERKRGMRKSRPETECDSIERVEFRGCCFVVKLCFFLLRSRFGIGVDKDEFTPWRLFP